MQYERWGKSPKFFLRADAINRLTHDWQPGSYLEVGAGTGEMTLEFIRRGFSGSLYDLGSDTRDKLRQRFEGESRIAVIDAIEDIPDASVDYLFAFEVLEHIEDDVTALRSWMRKLKPRGRLLVSVPAHQRKYSATDRRVGHVRRYEREQLRSLLAVAGCADIDIACYGFPLGNIGRLAGNLLEGRGQGEAKRDAVQRSIDSGVSQSSAVVRFSHMIRPWMLWPFFVAQRLTFTADVGDGYVVRAIRATDQ